MFPGEKFAYINSGEGFSLNIHIYLEPTRYSSEIIYIFFLDILIILKLSLIIMNNYLNMALFVASGLPFSVRSYEVAQWI